MLYQIAYDFMMLGGNVALVSRKKKDLDDIALKLTNKCNNNTKAIGYDLNLKDHTKYESVIDLILKDFKHIDVLVNGAAGNFLAFAENLSYNAFKTVIEIDTLSTFYMSKLVFTKCFKKNYFNHINNNSTDLHSFESGCIINISANLHHLGTLMNSHAAAAKAGVDAITKSLALEFGPYKVRVNGICPGFIEGTEGFDRLSNPNANKNNNYKKNEDKNALSDIVNYIPVQRLGNRSDISNCFVFLASQSSNYITGQTIEVDGGQKSIMPNFIINYPGFIKYWKPKF